MLKGKESEGKMAEEIELQDWADNMTKAHDNHRKAIEVLYGDTEALKQKGKHYEERIEHLEQLINSLRISMNRMLEHLDITIED
jgi:hypothetical protein